MTATVEDTDFTAEGLHLSNDDLSITVAAAGNDRLLLVALVNEDADWLDGNTDDIRNLITFDGDSLTYSTITHTGAGDASVAYCLIKDADMNAAAGTYTVDYTGAFMNHTSMVAYYLEGVNQTTPIKDNDSVNITSANNWTISGLDSTLGDVSIINAVNESTAGTFTFTAYPSQTAVASSVTIGSNARYGAAYEESVDSIGVTAGGTITTPVASAVIIGDVTATAHGQTGAINLNHTVSSTSTVVLPKAVLTNPTVSQVLQTSCVTSVTTDKDNGVISMVVVPYSDAPSVEQIRSGQQSDGSAAIAIGTHPVSSTGEQVLSKTTGLSAGASYDVYFVHTDITNTSSLSVFTYLKTRQPIDEVEEEGNTIETTDMIVDVVRSSWNLN